MRRSSGPSLARRGRLVPGRLAELTRSAAPVAAALVARAAAAAAHRRVAGAMDFRPLYKADRHLYSIGCNLTQGALDGACYDLLASEASLTSFLAIARGEAPRRHWFQLGRLFIRAAGRLGLLSWGGTMFEYLMPRLLLRSLAGTLVAEACETAVARQIEYGRQKGVPWGISESAFNAQYVDGDYQYQAFGVPGLGLKRGLERDLVVAPYATALAVMVRPHEVIENFRRLAAEGGLGPYGFYEAIDYTPSRLAKGERLIVVRSYMAHHQGMSLVALANTLLDEPMPRRFHAEPMVRAVDLLLQERIPPDAPIVEPPDAEAPDPTPAGSRREAPPLLSRRSADHAATPAPAHAPALQRPVRGDAHQRRLRLQHLPRPRRDPLARGRHPRRMGPVPLYPRPRLGRRLVGRPPADPPRGRRLRGRLLGRQGDLPPPRRADRDPHGGHRLARGPGRGPPGHGHEPRRPPPRPGADQLRRGRPQPARGRPGAPGLRQALSGDRVGARPRRRLALPAPAPFGRPGGGLGGPRVGRRPTADAERARSSTRPTAPASSAAAGRRPNPRRSTPARSSRGRPGRSSTRS